MLRHNAAWKVKFFQLDIKLCMAGPFTLILYLELILNTLLLHSVWLSHKDQEVMYIWQEFLCLVLSQSCILYNCQRNWSGISDNKELFFYHIMNKYHI